LRGKAFEIAGAMPGFSVDAILCSLLLYHLASSQMQKGFSMSLLDSILSKLGLEKKPAAPAATAPAASTAPKMAPYTPVSSASDVHKAIEVVDVVKMLDGMAKKNPMKLNWKESINDLLVLLDLPHSADDLKELAVELKCPDTIINDSFKRNMWLHKAVLKAIADNGGNIPVGLLS
jgi:hypothetical protein